MENTARLLSASPSSYSCRSCSTLIRASCHIGDLSRHTSTPPAPLLLLFSIYRTSYTIKRWWFFFIVSSSNALITFSRQELHDIGLSLNAHFTASHLRLQDDQALCGLFLGAGSNADDKRKKGTGLQPTLSHPCAYADHQHKPDQQWASKKLY